MQDLSSTPSEASSASPETDLAQALGELSSLLLATENVEHLLTRVAVLAASSIGVPLSCGITLMPDRRPVTLATSDERAAMLDELQYANGDGPCLHAMATGTTVAVPDLTVEDRWGDYPARLIASGVRSTLSFPLLVDGQGVGALNLYAFEVGAFTARAERAAALFAASASGVIATALRLADQVALTEQLRSALSSRTVIDQAIGVLIHDRRCDPDEAFDILRAASQRRNVKLRTVAEEMVTAMSRKPRAEKSSAAPAS